MAVGMDMKPSGVSMKPMVFRMEQNMNTRLEKRQIRLFLKIKSLCRLQLVSSLTIFHTS